MLLLLHFACSHTVHASPYTALYVLHTEDPPIVHRDLKGENIFLTEDLHCKLADFDLALLIPYDPNCDVCGSIGYMAPEMLRCAVCSPRAFVVLSVGAYCRLSPRYHMWNMDRVFSCHAHVARCRTGFWISTPKNEKDEDAVAAAAGKWRGDGAAGGD